MILLVNGPSSAGKTSLAEALQALWPGPLIHCGIDNFSRMLPPAYIGFDPKPGERAWEGMRWTQGTAEGRPTLVMTPGPLGEKWMHDMRRLIATMARLGNDVVVDEILTRPESIADYREAFAGIEAWMIGVRCELEILEQREQQRNRRITGQARAGFAAAHAMARYDIEVDSGKWSPAECARQILAQIAAQVRPAGELSGG